MDQERRRVPRYPFIATAEVIAESSGAKIAARVSELSLYGCFLELGEPLEQGAKARVKIYAEGRFFEAQANIVYSQPKKGMGVSFLNVYPHYQNVLKRWLLEAARTKLEKQG